MSENSQIVRVLDGAIERLHQTDYSPSVELATSLAGAARHALAQATRPEEIKGVRDKLSTIEHWFKKQRATLIESNLLVAERLRAERKVGAWLRKNVHPGGDRQSEKALLPEVTMLSDVGISRRDSHKWQRMAAIDEADFETWVQECLNDRELSTAGALRLWAQLAHTGSFVQEAPVPPGKFNGVIVDPPWPMQKIDRLVTPTQTALDYPTMSLEEIAAFPVGEMCAEDCHVFLWTTQRFLPQAFDIIQGWGCRYVFTMVWHKDGGFQPFNLPMYNCEFVLYGRIGHPVFVDFKAFPTCFNAKRTGHSRKPAEFYQLVRRVCEGPLIDVFSRQPHAGFEQFGNQTERREE